MSSQGLRQVRIHLAGSIHDSATDEQARGIREFVEKFARRVFREGGSIVHGSDPTLTPSLVRAAESFVSAGGNKEALTLVRSHQFANNPEQIAEIEALRKCLAVHIIPVHVGNPNRPLATMREWMADRCDVVVAIGGRNWDVSGVAPGVTTELEAAIELGKPAFLISAFGGAVAEYLHEQDRRVLDRLRNGLGSEANRALADSDATTLINTIVAQIKLLPLHRESVTGGRLFRILALDGGGIRGAFTAAVLAQWDDMIRSGGGNNIVQHFDLVAGTSTGAILAIGLALGLTPREILEFYLKQGPKIFPKDRTLRHWLKSKHDSGTLRQVLQSVFGDRRLAEASCRLVIPTVRAFHGESEAIVTAHCADRTAFAEISAVDAALASSAAPTYFDEAVVKHSIGPGTYLDGGIWANNPVLPAIAEAVRHLKVPLDRIDMLSVGTLGNERDFTDVLGKGKAGFAPSSIDLFFAAQEHAAQSIADSLLGSARHLRVNQQTPNQIPLDDTAALEDMRSRGRNVGQDTFVAVRSRFLDGFFASDWRCAPPS